MIWWRKKRSTETEKSNANVQQLPVHIQTVYAIGDVHGMINLARKAEQEIASDLDFDPETSLILYLGDLVDRGPDSAFVLDFLKLFPGVLVNFLVKPELLGISRKNLQNS